MSSMNQIASDLYKAITESDGRKPKPYDTKAEVQRIEGDTVWVNFPGGDTETPVQRTNNANVGDAVMVRVSGGRAWLLGNNTSPATDDRVAIQAGETAGEAVERATVARLAANMASEDAARATEYADEAKTAADSSARLLNDMQTAAEQAGTTLTQIYSDAENAQESANSAQQSASTALDHLSIVEDVVGVLELVSKNGQYQQTQDEEVRTDKWYFTKEYVKSEDTKINSNKTYYTRSATEPYEYTAVQNPVVADLHLYYEESYRVVANPDGNPSQHGWYEITDIKESIQNYVSSHLAVTDEGLWIQLDKDDTKVLLSAEQGVVMYDTSGHIVGRYGQTAQIGDGNGFHIVIDGEKLSFYNKTYEVAYMSGQKLYIPQSVVLEQMDLGRLVGEEYTDPATGETKYGLGQWSWKVHANSENPPRNNLNLKWIG